MLKINFKRLNFWLSIVIYLLLEYSYVVFVSRIYPNFDYTFDLSKYVLMKATFLVILYFVNKIKSDFMYVITMIFLIIMLIPNFILYQFMKFNFMIVVYEVLFILYLAFLGQFNISHKRNVVFLSNNKSVMLFIFAFVVMIPYFITYKANVNLSVFSLGKKLYLQRAEAISEANTYIRYTMHWLGKIILPILLLLSLTEKKRFIFVLTLVLMLYLFVILSHKVMLFAPMVVLFFYFIPNTKIQITMIFLGIIALIVSCRLLSEYADMINFEATFVRRLFFIPAVLNDNYMDFFAGRPLYFSNSILSSFVDYKYDLEPAYLIAKVYWHNHASANNGFISNGFMQLGHWGSVLFIFLLGLIIKLIDAIKINSRYNGIFIITLFTFVSSAFLTSLLTHGVLFLILMSYLFLQNTQKIKK